MSGIWVLFIIGCMAAGFYYKFRQKMIKAETEINEII